jgi:hypothetical protein
MVVVVPDKFVVGLVILQVDPEMVVVVHDKFVAGLVMLQFVPDMVVVVPNRFVVALLTYKVGLLIVVCIDDANRPY